MRNVTKKWFMQIDRLVCLYLGFKKEEIRPYAVEFKKGQILVKNFMAFRRHQISESWKQYTQYNFSQISQDHKTKLGLALGKILANDLVISFIDTPIKHT